MYRAFRITLESALLPYNVYELIKDELGHPADAILADRGQELKIALDAETAYIGGVVYIGDFLISPIRYGWVLSFSTFPFNVGPVRGNSVCFKDFWLMTDTPGATVLINTQST